jgi:hypothetical protein
MKKDIIKNKYVLEMMNGNKKITTYNVFIKDSFNIIYNRKSLNILPEYIKKDIYKYKNIKANIVIVVLAKIWMDENNYYIKHKYKMLDNINILFTNNLYNSIILYNNVINTYQEDKNVTSLKIKQKLFIIIHLPFRILRKLLLF